MEHTETPPSVPGEVPPAVTSAKHARNGPSVASIGDAGRHHRPLARRAEPAGGPGQERPRPAPAGRDRRRSPHLLPPPRGLGPHPLRPARTPGPNGGSAPPGGPDTP